MKTSNQEPKPFKAGDIIYSHNDPAEYIFLIHSGKVRIESKHGLELGVLETGEIFGEVGHIIESPRTVTAVAVTNSLIRIIDEKTIKEKMNKADPVLAAIVRGLSLRIGDANALAEKHWLELNVYKSLNK